VGAIGAYPALAEGETVTAAKFNSRLSTLWNDYLSLIDSSNLASKYTYTIDEIVVALPVLSIPWLIVTQNKVQVLVHASASLGGGAGAPDSVTMQLESGGGFATQHFNPAAQIVTEGAGPVSVPLAAATQSVPGGTQMRLNITGIGAAPTLLTVRLLWKIILGVDPATGVA